MDEPTSEVSPQATEVEALSPEQKRNKDVMEGLKSKYPDAMKPLGSEAYLCTKSREGIFSSFFIGVFFTKDGFFKVSCDNLKTEYSQINPQKIVDFAQILGAGFGAQNPEREEKASPEQFGLSKDVLPYGRTFTVRKVDLNYENERTELKDLLSKAQAEEERKKPKVVEGVSADEILKDF